MTRSLREMGCREGVSVGEWRTERELATAIRRLSAILLRSVPDGRDESQRNGLSKFHFSHVEGSTDAIRSPNKCDSPTTERLMKSPTPLGILALISWSDEYGCIFIQ